MDLYPLKSLFLPWVNYMTIKQNLGKKEWVLRVSWSAGKVTDTVLFELWNASKHAFYTENYISQGEQGCCLG